METRNTDEDAESQTQLWSLLDNLFTNAFHIQLMHTIHHVCFQLFDPRNRSSESATFTQATFTFSFCRFKFKLKLAKNANAVNFNLLCGFLFTTKPNLAIPVQQVNHLTQIVTANIFKHVPHSFCFSAIFSSSKVQMFISTS
jgi:hypothetical protein